MTYRENKDEIFTKMVEYLSTVPGDTLTTVSELLETLYPGENDICMGLCSFMNGKKATMIQIFLMANNGHWK